MYVSLCIYVCLYKYPTALAGDPATVPEPDLDLDLDLDLDSNFFTFLLLLKSFLDHFGDLLGL